jgi:hypothetical protein
MSPAEAAVSCYSGYTFAQEPRAILWEGRRYEVERVEQRWRTPDGPGFRVEVEQGMSFDIQYHELEDRWSVDLLKAGATSDR